MQNRSELKAKIIAEHIMLKFQLYLGGFLTTPVVMHITHPEWRSLYLQ